MQQSSGTRLSGECIFCREQKVLSDEHVIPEALGGCYHIYSVCIDCNSWLGRKVDAPLVNHKLTQLHRFLHELEGKNGVPNPFGGEMSVSGSSMKYRSTLGADRELGVETLPKVVEHRDENGEVKSIEITVDARDPDEAHAILARKLERLNIDPATMAPLEIRRSTVDGPFIVSWTIDTREFKIAFLKMAYEFAVDQLPAFYESDEAKDIAQTLLRADHDRAAQYVRIGDGLQAEVFEPFLNFLDLDARKHYMVLLQTHLGLVCCIKLEGTFCLGIVLSEQRYMAPEQWVIGINDVEQQTFVTLDFAQLLNRCMGPIMTRPGYEFDTREEAEMGQREISHPTYRFEGQGTDVIPVYARDGVRHPDDLFALLRHAECSTQLDHQGSVQVFILDPSQKYHLRAVETGNLHRIVAFEVSRSLIAKA